MVILIEQYRHPLRPPAVGAAGRVDGRRRRTRPAGGGPGTGGGDRLRRRSLVGAAGRGHLTGLHRGDRPDLPGHRTDRGRPAGQRARGGGPAGRPGAADRRRRVGAGRPDRQRDGGRRHPGRPTPCCAAAPSSSTGPTRRSSTRSAVDRATPGRRPPDAPPLDGSAPTRRPSIAGLPPSRGSATRTVRRAQARRCAVTSITWPSSAASPATPCCPTAETCSATCCFWPHRAARRSARSPQPTSPTTSRPAHGDRRAPGAGRVVGRPGRGRGPWLAPFLLAEGAVGATPSRDVRPPAPAKRLPKALPVDTITALLEAASGTDPRGLRDRALLELLYATGARISEAVGLESTMSTTSAAPLTVRASSRWCRWSGCAARVPRSGWCRSGPTRSRPAGVSGPRPARPGRGRRRRTSGGAVPEQPRRPAVPAERLAGAAGHRRAGRHPSGTRCPGSRRTPCGTPSPPICWRAAPTSGRYRSCSGTPRSPPRRSTRWSRSTRCARSTPPRTRGLGRRSGRPVLLRMPHYESTGRRRRTT